MATLIIRTDGELDSELRTPVARMDKCMSEFARGVLRRQLVPIRSWLTDEDVYAEVS